MYEQVKTPKENKSRVGANAVARKKNSVKQCLGFVDNRTESVSQRKIQDLVTNNHHDQQGIKLQGVTTNVAQLKLIMKDLDVDYDESTVDEDIKALADYLFEDFEYAEKKITKEDIVSVIKNLATKGGIYPKRI